MAFAFEDVSRMFRDDAAAAPYSNRVSMSPLSALRYSM